VYESGSCVSCELKLYDSNNQERYIYIEGSVIQPANCLIAALDITERHKTEKKIYKRDERLQELNATKDKLLAIIGHDLRGPFTSIVGFSELLQEHIHKKNYDNIEKITDIIYNSSLQAMDLLSNLLEWASLQTGKIQTNPVSIIFNDLVDAVLALLNCSIEQKSIVVSKNINPKLSIHADYDMISNVLRNLISNAIKFTPNGGTIMIEARDQSEDLLIAISDTGVGISAADIKKIFRPDIVFSTKGTQFEEGTGLGLLLSKEFIEKHGGKLWAESQPGIGSIFYFTIPSKN
jgi:signal transduction histidine kinase